MRKQPGPRASLPSDKLPSFGVALCRRMETSRTLKNVFANLRCPFITRRHGDRLLIDLRTVLPRQDQRLVDMVVGPTNSAAETPAETAAPASV